MQDIPSFGGAWGGFAYRSYPQPPNSGGREDTQQEAMSLSITPYHLAKQVMRG